MNTDTCGGIRALVYANTRFFYDICRPLEIHMHTVLATTRARRVAVRAAHMRHRPGHFKWLSGVWGRCSALYGSAPLQWPGAMLSVFRPRSTPALDQSPASIRGFN